MASEIFGLRIHIYSVPILCLALFLCCWQSKADSDRSCGKKLTRCPEYLKKKNRCYCPSGKPVKPICVQGEWKYQPCGATETPFQTTQLTTTPSPTTETPFQTTQLKTTPTQCPELNKIIHGTIEYSDGGSRHPNSFAKYTCDSGTSTFTVYCMSGGQWSKEPEPNMCYCTAPNTGKKDTLEVSFHPPQKSGFFVLKTEAKYYCKNKKVLVLTLTCENRDHIGKWISLPSSLPVEKCISPRLPTVGVPASKSTKPSLHHTDERTVIIVSGTTGAILGALIILVVIVSCQRRIHYHRMRRARIRHRQDQEAFAAFITYHRDARLLLPSYDEAINQQEQGQPPSFEEALGHYEEPTLPPGHTPSEDGRPSDTQIPSATPGNETENPPGTSTSSDNHSDAVPLLNSQSSPTSDNSRLFRNLRALFGGRTFRPDAIYCRFVPDDVGESEAQTSTRTAERESTDSSADVEIAEVLTRAGLC